MRLNKFLLPLAIVLFIGFLSLVFSLRTYQLSQNRQEPTIAVVSGALVCADNFSDNFSGTSVNTAKWSVHKNGSGAEVKIESGKLALSLATSMAATDANVATKKSLSGDFILEVDNLSLTRTGNGTVGAVIMLPIDSSGDVKGLSISRKSKSGENTHALTARLTLKDGTFEDKTVQINASSAPKFRIERKAGKVKVQYKLNAGYQNLLSSTKAFSDEIDFVALAVNHLGVPRPQVKAVFDNVKISCPAGSSGSPSPSVKPSKKPSPSPSAAASIDPSASPSSSPSTNQASFIIHKFLDANKNGVREVGEGPTNRAWEFTYQVNSAEKKTYTIEPGSQSGQTIYVDKGSQVKVEELGQDSWINTTGASVEKTLLENKLYTYYFGNWPVGGVPVSTPSGGGFPPTQPNTGSPTSLTIGVIGIGAILLMLKLIL